VRAPKGHGISQRGRLLALVAVAGLVFMLCVVLTLNGFIAETHELLVSSQARGSEALDALGRTRSNVLLTAGAGVLLACGSVLVVTSRRGG
jgi:hypothetical protein